MFNLNQHLRGLAVK